MPSLFRGKLDAFRRSRGAVTRLWDGFTRLWDDFTRTRDGAERAAHAGPLAPKTLRKAVPTELGKLAGQLNLAFAGNEAVLLSSGLELAAAPVAVPPPAAPAQGEIEMGPQSGRMVLRGKRVAGSVNPLWLFATDPSLPRAQWSYRLCNDDTLVATGLTPGQRLYACVACLNGASATENLLFTEARPRYVE